MMVVRAALGVAAAAAGGCGAGFAELLNSIFEERPVPVPPFTGEVPLRLEPVVDNARFPVNLVFLPDGTLLYTEKNTGAVRAVLPDGSLRPDPVADFVTAGLAQGGCLGLALDPAFEQNGYLYAGHSANALPVDNSFPRSEYRVSRVTIRDLAARPGSETLIAAFPAGTLPGHEGGNIHFGPDGRLYVSLGDRSNNTAPNVEAQDPARPAGKVLRLAADGTIPPDNPFGPQSPAFAVGLRNAFDFTFDPATGRMWAGDNGFGGPTEELNLIEAGGNYGWPFVGGLADQPSEQAFAASTPAYRDPLLLVDIAPTGLAFNPGDAYGAAFNGHLFIAEWVPGTIRRVQLSADRRSVAGAAVFAAGIPGGMNDLAFSPAGILHVSTSTAVYRLAPTGG
jgi:glucose/arabinose dehydrogenase